MLFATLAVLVLLGATYSVLIAGDDKEVRLLFGQRDGLSTQGAHDGFAGEVLTVAIDTVAAYETYVRSLQVLQAVPTTGGHVDTPLLSVDVQVDPDNGNATYADVGYYNLTMEGVLRQLPPLDVGATLRHLRDSGWELLFPDEPSGDELLFNVTHDGRTYATFIVHPSASAVEAIVYPAGPFNGTRIVATPWVVEKNDDQGRLVELWVRNPVTTFELNPFGTELTVHNTVCKNGKCLPRGVVRDTCRALGACAPSYVVGAHYGAGPNPLPGTLLHLWANDTIHGGAGIEVLDAYQGRFEVPRWQGNPFTAEGVWVEAPRSGERLAGVTLKLPTTEDPTLQIAITGDVVRTLAGSDLAHQADLAEWSLGVSLGGTTASTQSLYPGLDLASGLLIGAWSDADGEVKALHINSLLDLGEIARIVGDPQGDLNVLIDSIGANVTLPGSEIVPSHEAVETLVAGLTGPAMGAVVQIRDRATQEVWAQVRVVESAAGCSIETLGCIGVIVGPVQALVDGFTVPGLDVVPVPSTGPAPTPGPTPDPVVVIGDVRTEGEQLVALVDTLRGTVFGYVPVLDVPDDVCLPTVPDRAPVCSSEIPSGAGIMAAAIGFVDGEQAEVKAFVEDPQGGTITLEGREGTLAQIGAGSLYVAGAGASLGPGGVLTVRGLDGTETCVRHTTPSADGPTWPGLEVGCDGLMGQSHVIEPAAHYTLQDGRLTSFVVDDPTTGDQVLLFTDNGEHAELTVAFAGLTQAIRLPAHAVTISGNPVTSSSFTIGIAEESVAAGSLFSSVALLKQTYESGRRAVSGLPAGSELGVVFQLLEGPESDLRVSDGRTYLLSNEGQLGGAAWVSGLRDNAFRIDVDEEQMTPPHVDLVYRINNAPVYGASPAVALPVSGTDPDARLRTHEGVLPASVLAPFQEGATLHFALAWTERVGPVAAVFWDDNGGHGYRYRLDTAAPVAVLAAPASSDAAAFRVSWSSSGDAGSGLSHYRVRSAATATPGTGDWTDWIAERSATEPLHADFNGQPGTTYSFQAAACDRAHNCGVWSSLRTVQVAAVAAPQPAAPQITVAAPLAGATLTGVTTLLWQVEYDGPGTPIVNVAQQRAGTVEWVPVYSGTAGTTSWRTQELVDGTYTLRFEVTDGTYTKTASVSVRLHNGNPDPNLEAVRQAGSGAPTVDGDGGPEGGDERSQRSPWLVPVLSVGFVLVLAGAGFGTYLARRRR